MANEQNLRPLNTRTKKERREIAIKAGKASGEARRQKKTMKEQAELLLSLSVKNSKLKKVMKDLGIEEEEQTNQMAMIVSMLNTALKGNKGSVSAFNTLQATIGEKPIEKVEIAKSTDETIKEVDEYLCKKKKN